MAQEIEIEYKNLLTKNEFDHILHNYPFSTDGIKQINYYFETPNFSLKKSGCALRIREKDGKFVLTLKEPHPDGLLETHDPLSKQEAVNWMNGTIIRKQNVMSRLKEKQIPVEKITCYGSLITERREIKYENVLLVLDYSMYNNTTDYELEVEAPSVEIGSKFFNKFLAENNINNRKTPNKIERFFNSFTRD